MSKKKSKASTGSRKRKYQVEMPGLGSLHLHAAPRPPDEPLRKDLAPDSSTWFSPEMIRHLIDRIKSI